MNAQRRVLPAVFAVLRHSTTALIGRARRPGNALLGGSSPLALSMWLALLLIAIYGLDAGQGFVKDDFAWILTSRIETLHDVNRLFTQPAPGFYRPLVALSFGINEHLFGLAPAGYAVTNFLLLVGIIAGIAVLVRALGLTLTHGLVAAALWALNFHGINMALLWMSGRTSLLLTLFAVIAALAFVRRRYAIAGLLVFAAMLSKEEAVMLPFILLAWAVMDRHRRDGETLASAGKGGLRASWPSFAALVGYMALRAQTDAITPATAPSFYQLSAGPGHLVRNVLEYADRSATLAVVVVLLLWAVARHRPHLESIERGLIGNGVIWLIGGFAITVWLPVRSSLYACFPSVGTAMISVAVAAAVWRDVSRHLRWRVMVAGLLLPLLLLPIYRSRNARLANEARLSAQALAIVTHAIKENPRIDTVVFHDDPRQRPSFAAAFGTLLPTAVELATGRQLNVELVAPRRASAGVIPRESTVLQVVLEKGAPVRVDEGRSRDRQPGS